MYQIIKRKKSISHLTVVDSMISTPMKVLIYLSKRRFRCQHFNRCPILVATMPTNYYTIRRIWIIDAIHLIRTKIFSIWSISMCQSTLDTVIRGHSLRVAQTFMTMCVATLWVDGAAHHRCKMMCFDHSNCYKWTNSCERAAQPWIVHVQAARMCRTKAIPIPIPIGIWIRQSLSKNMTTPKRR